MSHVQYQFSKSLMVSVTITQTGCRVFISEFLYSTVTMITQSPPKITTVLSMFLVIHASFPVN
jgi:hypothetical protein